MEITDKEGRPQINMGPGLAGRKKKKTRILLAWLSSTGLPEEMRGLHPQSEDRLDQVSDKSNLNHVHPSLHTEQLYADVSLYYTLVYQARSVRLVCRKGHHQKSSHRLRIVRCCSLSLLLPFRVLREAVLLSDCFRMHTVYKCSCHISEHFLKIPHLYSSLFYSFYDQVIDSLS